MSGPVLLFDGVCNLCNASVQFVIDHETKPPQLSFASLQSEPGRAIIEKSGATVPEGDPDSILLRLEGTSLFDKSSAAVRIARFLRWPYRALVVFIIIPRPLRDLVYKFIARNRYRWFGKSETCRVPTPELRARFLK